jgi:hypothetical protein
MDNASPLFRGRLSFRENRAVAFTVLFSAFSLSACGHDRWDAIVYPDRSDLTEYEIAGVYSSLEACRAAAEERLNKLGARSSGDYECGANCEYREGWGDTRICESTRQ